MKTIKLSILLLALLTIGQAKAQGLSGSGTTDDPYLITSADDWNTFAQSVTNGTTYAGQFVQLDADITASVMAGSHTGESNYHAFSGTFDGDGHTITLALSGSGEGTALFSDLEGATLKNLKAQGTVTTNKNRPATFAAFVFGNSTIRNCWSTVAVLSTKTNSWVDGGGFVGRVSSNATLNMTDCAFHGSVTFTEGATTGGGMVGYTQSNATVNLTNCLYSPTSLTLNVSEYNPRVFVSGSVEGNLTNCYYNNVAAASVLGKQGTDASNMSNEALAAALGAGWHVYNNMVVPFTGTYYISSAAEWNAFATAVNNGKSYSGQLVTLTTDIPTAEEIANNTTAVTTMAGTESYPFCGTLDGGGHTITLALSGNGQGTALFYLIEGATLKNLKVQGTVTTTGYRPATFAAFVEGNSTISNCWSTVAVSSTKTNSWVDGGGFVGRVSGTASLNMTGCAFHGSVTFTPSATTGGGMVGYTQAGATVNLTNCLYSPTALTLNVSQYYPRIFVSGDVAGNLTNCYYNDVAADSRLGKQGKQMRSITGDANVTVAFDGEATTYNLSGISAYSPGIVYDSTLYAGQGDTVSLNLGCTTPPDYVCIGFSASAGTLTGTANPYTLAMPNEDVTLQAIIESLSSVNYIDGDSVVHTCNNFTILTGDETTLEAGWYAVYDNLTYDSTLTLNGDVNLILCNGKTMTVTPESGRGIYGFQKSLTIYGQSLDSIAGTLNVIGDGSNRAIDLNAGAYTQHSGNVVANNSNADALIAYNITINGGSIHANGGLFGIYASNLTINGGSIHANGRSQGIYADGSIINGGKVEASSIFAWNNITLGWTNTDDYILAGSYETVEGTLSVKSGQAFYCEEDENVIVSGTLDEDQIDAIGGKTLRPHFVNYMDGEGEMHICTDFTVLTGNETTLEAGWYVADSDLAYDHTLTLNGDVTLILCNDKTMTVTTDSGSGIDGLMSNLTLYSQSLDSIVAGTLNVMGDGSDPAIDLFAGTYTQHSGNVVVSNSGGNALQASHIIMYGGSIHVSSGWDGIVAAMTINGGSINANGSNYGIYTSGSMTINGGSIHANGGDSGIYAPDLTINGGKVDASSIHADDSITLGWTNTDDYILAGRYEANTISVKSGQAFYYEDEDFKHLIEPIVISGTLNSGEISAIGGKTLRPRFVNYMDSAGETHICKYFTILTGGETELEAGWYAVDHDITYDSTLTLNGDVTLILCNGKTMTVTPESGSGIDGFQKSLTIYGQSLDSIAGTLNVIGDGSNTAINIFGTYTQHSGNVVANNSNADALSADNIIINGGSINANGSDRGIDAGDLTINGGSIHANGRSQGIYADESIIINGGSINANGGDYCIYTSGSMTINGGSIHANGSDEGIYTEVLTINGGTINANGDNKGIQANNLTINGGKVEASSIWADDNITLGWANTDDYILAGSYGGNASHTIAVKSGQAFYYEAYWGENFIVSGTLDGDQIDAIRGKTLRPHIIPTTVTKQIAGYGTGDGGWQLIALPMYGTINPATVGNLIASNAARYDLYRFEPSHEGNEWENYKADSTFKLETGKGYLYANADNVTLTFSGPSYIGDSCEIALVYDSTDYQKCWNLVGNPFDGNATLDREYYVLDESGLDINPEPMPATTPIPPCTAVFVKAVSDGDKAVFSKVTQ